MGNFESRNVHPQLIFPQLLKGKEPFLRSLYNLKYPCGCAAVTIPVSDSDFFFFNTMLYRKFYTRTLSLITTDNCFNECCQL